MSELSSRWKCYARQAVTATVCMFFLLWLLFDSDLLVLASLGSTAFIVFALPETSAARPRNVIGGHLAGLVSGALIVFFFERFSVASFSHRGASGLLRRVGWPVPFYHEGDEHRASTRRWNGPQDCDGGAFPSYGRRRCGRGGVIGAGPVSHPCSAPLMRG